MIRLAACALLALTGGCTLSSTMPLIAESEQVPGLGDGKYQVYIALLAEDAAKLSKTERKRCVDPGYHGEGRQAPDAPIERKHIVYCDRDPGTKQDAPAITLRWTDGHYHIDKPESPATMRFRSAPGGLYLLQADEFSKPGYHDYWFARTRSDALEMFMLACSEFPSLKKPGETEPRSCGITSFATVQSELDAYAAGIAAGRKAPVAILKRLR